MNIKNKTADDIEKLLTKAGPRIQPDEEIKQAVYAEVHKTWLQQTRTPFYKNPLFLAAASVFLFVGIFVVTFINDDNQANYNIAKPIQISGQIQISQDNQNWTNLDIDKTINPGDYVKTKSNNRMLIELDNGNTIRVDENSFIQIVDRNEIQLKQGKIYVASAEHAPLRKLLITTELASINHIGTQYQIEFNNGELNVGVRDGKVIIQSEEKHREIAKGFEVTLNEEGVFNQQTISPFDLKWQWTQKIPKQFDIQDKTVQQYLNWVSLETGYPIIWQSRKDRLDATKIKLSGSINGVLPKDSLNVILPTTRFKYQISETAIHISS